MRVATEDIATVARRTYVCTRKEAYKHRERAEFKAAQAARRTGEPFGAYHCPETGDHYHIGHTRPPRLSKVTFFNVPKHGKEGIHAANALPQPARSVHL